jgi:hypothetical protein
MTRDQATSWIVHSGQAELSVAEAQRHALTAQLPDSAPLQMGQAPFDAGEVVMIAPQKVGPER